MHPNSKKCEKSSKVKPIPNEVFALRYGYRPSQGKSEQGFRPSLYMKSSNTITIK
jgi:hypothetical protein